MADFADRQISQLSGGQQQRVFLARALAQEARLYFMDEPFAGVDAATERAIVEVLRDLDSRGPHGDLRPPRPADRARTTSTTCCCSTCASSRPGRSRTTLNAENLRRTYGGRLALLDDVPATALGACERSGVNEAWRRRISLARAGRVAAVLTLQGRLQHRVVLVAVTACLGVAAGVVGTFTLLRKRALMSDALSHATLPGIASPSWPRRRSGMDGRSLPVLLARRRRLRRRSAC